jgi:hypothetical protein
VVGSQLLSINTKTFFNTSGHERLGKAPMDDNSLNNIAPHLNPVWPCDSLVVADLSSHGMPGRFEQFWTRRVSDTVFEISCIPFFSYGIALGDKVEVNEGCVIQKVVERGGHKTLRVAVANKKNLDHLHEVLHEWVEKTGLLYEWYASGYLAVDVPPDAQAELNTSLLDQLRGAGEISTELDQ